MADWATMPTSTSTLTSTSQGENVTCSTLYAPCTLYVSRHSWHLGNRLGSHPRFCGRGRVVDGAFWSHLGHPLEWNGLMGEDGARLLFSDACAAVAKSGREKTGGSLTSVRLKLTWEWEGLGENSGAPAGD